MSFKENVDFPCYLISDMHAGSAEADDGSLIANEAFTSIAITSSDFASRLSSHDLGSIDPCLRHPKWNGPHE